MVTQNKFVLCWYLRPLESLEEDFSRSAVTHLERDKRKYILLIIIFTAK